MFTRGYNVNIDPEYIKPGSSIQGGYLMAMTWHGYLETMDVLEVAAVQGEDLTTQGWSLRASQPFFSSFFQGS